MLVPLKWLKEYVDIDDINTSELCDKMTMSGSNVETVRVSGHDIEGVVVGKIEDIKSHPNADKLVIVIVNIGSERIQIVTGATNISIGDYIPVALDGAKLPNGIKINRGELRGEMSDGMLCSQEELNIPKSVIPESIRDGIWILEGSYELGQDIRNVIELGEETIEFEITSNRPDCLSMIGMAREVAATLERVLKYPEIEIEGIDQNASDYAKVIIDDIEGCGRYVAKVIKDVTIKPSPDWMQRRLANAGVRPINNIVDITNYVMLEYGQPLHAFDIDYVQDATIVVRRGKKGGTFKTLDGVLRNIDDNMTMICDTEKELAIAGVMGGEESEITSKTKTILLESAYFRPEGVRLTSKRLGLRTEASSRFEKGLDPNIAALAADRACQLIEELGAGKVLKGSVDAYPSEIKAKKILVRPQRMNYLLGTNLTTGQMVSILESLEFEIVEQEGSLEVRVPTYRIDIDQEVDFVEEIGRIYGFDKIPSTMIRGNITVGGKDREENIQDVTKQVLNAMGLFEVLTYSFISPKGAEKIRLDEDSIKRKFIRLLNPLGDETSVMRTSLLPNMLDVMTRNYNRKIERFKGFELGRIFIPKESECSQLPYEQLNLVIGIYGREDFYGLKTVVNTLLDNLGIVEYEYEAEKNHPTYHPGRCANIIHENHPIGVLGELHPIVRENYGIDIRAYCAEIDFQLLLKLANLDSFYQPLPKYPSIVRDFAIIVRDEILVKDIEAIIKGQGGDILESYKLFDVYQGDQIDDGHKSIAYTLTYRHGDRTLKDEEANIVHNRILEKITSKLGGILRE